MWSIQRAHFLRGFINSLSKCQNTANSIYTSQFRALDHQTRERISNCIKSDPVVVFMKGTKEELMCGFSRNVKLVLEAHNVSFKDYNVLDDPELRDGVKEFSDWPTVPQVYVKGKFVGGSDIIVQMHKDGEITEFFDENKIPSKFSEKYETKG